MLALFGIFRADTLDGLIAYLFITSAAMFPAVLWLRARTPGIPILPAVAAFHFLYFAIPILRQDPTQVAYTPWELFRAAITVVLFLVTATVAWGLVLGRFPRRSQQATAGPDRLPRAPGQLLMFAGLAVGSAFQIALISGWLNDLGSFFGLVRAVALTTASTACYLLGNLRGLRRLQGQLWGLACVGLMSNVALSLSSLFLVGGMTFILAATLGYVIAVKRVRWGGVALVFAILFVFHAGKGEMRERYWPAGYSQSVSVAQVPRVMIEWFAAGTAAIASGESQQDIIDRASLLYMLLRVERMTPEDIPYLGGETYALLPTYLIPRFLDPSKAASQAGLDLLNIRYGVQTSEEVGTTAIGWGIIAEAFANFGLIGVVGAGGVFGLLSAFFTRWSTKAAPLSLPTLLSIAALISLTNLEADFGYLVVNLWQALVATLIFFIPIKYLSSGGPTPMPAPGQLHHS
ncbi:MAG TPA: hypothetical protein VMF32_00330 [Xanthobacteraceae bacterium]|nr:hypothetical protein [Xanthobacteraceae bacterium]